MVRVLVIFTLTLIFLRWILPGTKVGNDLHVASVDSLRNWASEPSIWSDSGFGEYSVSMLWSWPVNFLVGRLGMIGIPHTFLVQIIGIGSALLFGGIGAYKLSGWMGSLIFLTNSFFLLLVDGGQITLAMAYGLLPLCFWLYRQKAILKFSKSVLLLSIFDIRIVYLLLILIILDLVFNFLHLKSYILHHYKLGLVTALILVGFHAYWLLPSVLVRLPSLPTGYADVSQISFLSLATWKHALLLQQPHWYKNIFGQIARPRWDYMVIPALALLGLVVSKKWYWAAVAIVGIFLAKGANSPFGEVYSWLFVNMPGFNLFRDPVKFYFLIALAYSVLVSHASEWLTQRFKWFPILLISYILYLTSPVWLGHMTGTFSKPRFEKDYQELAEFLRKDARWGRVLWIPNKSPLGYSDTNHISLEGLGLTQLPAFASNTVGTYETMNFMNASKSAELLNIAGVQYIVYPPLDPLRDNLKPENVRYYDYFLGQLATNIWAKKLTTFGKVPVIETRQHQDLFFISDHIQEKVTIKDIYYPAANLGDSPDNDGWWKRTKSDLVWWRDFIQQKYQIDNDEYDIDGGWAIAEGNRKLEIKNKIFITGQTLWVRVLKSSRGGRIDFSQKSNLIGSAITLVLNPKESEIFYRGYQQTPDRRYHYKKAEYDWVKTGTLEADNLLNIETFGDINVINALAVTNKNEIITNPRVQKIIPDPTVKVTYNRINSTHYKVNVTGLKSSGTLIFSQSFDPLWRLSGKSPIKILDFLNGFQIDHDGEYDLVYEPQRYILPGLAMTGLTLIVLIGLWIRKSQPTV